MGQGRIGITIVASYKTFNFNTRWICKAIQPLDLVEHELVGGKVNREPLQCRLLAVLGLDNAGEGIFIGRQCHLEDRRIRKMHRNVGRWSGRGNIS